MRRFLLRALIGVATLMPFAARAQVKTPSMLDAAVTVGLTDILGLEQGSTGPGTGAPRKATIQQIANAITGANLTFSGTNTFSALQTLSGGASITGLVLGLTAHGVLIAENTGNVVATAAPTDGQLLVGQTSADPLPKTISGDCTMSSAGALACFGVTPASVAKGGTGDTTLAAHGVLVGEGTSAIAAATAMTSGQILVGQSGADPLPKTMTGDGSLDSAGILTVNSFGGTAFGTMAGENIGASCATGTVNLTTLTVVNGKITAC